jgi:hypothetical protein
VLHDAQSNIESNRFIVTQPHLPKVLSASRQEIKH